MADVSARTYSPCARARGDAINNAGSAKRRGRASGNRADRNRNRHRPHGGPFPAGADPDTAPPVTVGANMMPAVIIALEELPLTPNGKVDRQALLAPDLDAGTRDLPYVAPRDAIEIRLAETWREALEIARIGRGDNFFDLGGHSPLLARVRSEPRAGRR